MRMLKRRFFIDEISFPKNLSSCTSLMHMHSNRFDTLLERKFPQVDAIKLHLFECSKQKCVHATGRSQELRSLILCHNNMIVRKFAKKNKQMKA